MKKKKSKAKKRLNRMRQVMLPYEQRIELQGDHFISLVSEFYELFSKVKTREDEQLSENEMLLNVAQLCQLAWNIGTGCETREEIKEFVKDNVFQDFDGDQVFCDIITIAAAAKLRSFPNDDLLIENVEIDSSTDDQSPVIRIEWEEVTDDEYETPFIPLPGSWDAVKEDIQRQLDELR